MGKTIDFTMDFDRLLTSAKRRLEEGELVACILNLKEAEEYADTREKMLKVYNLYVEAFSRTGNSHAAMRMCAREAELRNTEEFYRLDFDNVRLDYSDDDRDLDPDIDFSLTCLYNDAAHLIEERRYDEAFAKLRSRPICADLCSPIVEALLDAVENDRKINLDKYLHVMSALFVYCRDRVGMARIMLEGGKNYCHRLAVENSDFLLEEAFPSDLCMIGEAYFRAAEPETAREFFKRALYYDPIDEDALYYMYVISILLEEKDTGKKYWDTYCAVYGMTGAPVKLLEKFFGSKDVKALVPYLTLPGKFLETAGREIFFDMVKFDETDVDEEFINKVCEFVTACPDETACYLLNGMGKMTGQPNRLRLLKELAVSARAPFAIKEYVVEKLVDEGYEGDLTLLTDKRVLCLRFTKLHRRVASIWQMIYKILLRTLPFSDAYIPLNCSLLSALIKRLDTLFVPDEEDVPFAVALTLINYVHKLRINIDAFAIMKTINIGREIIEEGLRRYNLETIII